MARFPKKVVQFGSFLAICAVIAFGCGGPKFPLCDNDEHCNVDGHHGVCLDHKCVACRDDEGCPTGQECKSGACEAAVGFCDDSHACAGGAACGKNHRCEKKVATVAVECDDDHPCSNINHKCQNGHCVSPPPGGPGCTEFAAPKFDFESPELRPETRAVLERLAKCLVSGSLKGRRVLLTGHCDARGEYEFNMGLGAERAEGAKNFLIGLGVPASALATSSRGKLDAAGQDDAGWANDRRVDIEVK
jgi:peptidoglycan-associated lipoprotein